MHSFLVAFLTLVVSCFAAENQQCAPQEILSQGFKVEFYNYPLNDKSGWEDNFPFDGYSKFGFIDSIESFNRYIGINTFPFFDEEVREEKKKNIFDKPMTTTNYSMKLSGFYKPPITRTQSFRIYAADGAYWKVYPAITCNKDQPGGETGGFMFSALSSQEENAEREYTIVEFDMEEGVYYYMEIFAFNSHDYTNFRVTIEYPYRRTDIVENVYQVKFGDDVVLPELPENASEVGEKAIVETGKGGKVKKGKPSNGGSKGSYQIQNDPIVIDLTSGEDPETGSKLGEAYVAGWGPINEDK